MKRLESGIIDGAARFPGKWSILARWWVVQGVFIWVAIAVFTWQTRTVSGPSGWVLGLRNWDGLARAAIQHDVLVATLCNTVGIAAVQWLVLLPVRRPEMGTGGKSLKVTVLMASGLIAAMLTAAGMAAWSVYELVTARNVPYEVSRTAVFAGPAVAWIGAGAWLWIWVRDARRPLQNTLSVFTERVFRGTVIEIAAILPIDYMVRRKTDCYCGEGTFWALIVAGVVGTIAFGPMVWLPLIARRRKEWYGGHCSACGYDMTATPGAARCPECGTGWRAGWKEESTDPDDERDEISA